MNLGPRQIGVLAILTCILLVPTDARAAMLGLDAGTYDVTLTCAFVGCGGPVTGTLTTDGNDVTSDSSGVSFWNGTWTAEPHEETGTVPEPASLTLLALGLSAAGLARRKPSR